jgi:hypothetical protein
MFVRDQEELNRINLMFFPDDVEKASRRLRMSRETYLKLYCSEGPLYPVHLSQLELNAREARKF